MKGSHFLLYWLIGTICGIGIGALIMHQEFNHKINEQIIRIHELQLKVDSLVLCGRAAAKEKYKSAVLMHCKEYEITQLDFNEIDSIYMVLDCDVQNSLNALFENRGIILK